MGLRSDLQTVLQRVAGDNNKVYAQPPQNTKLSYPCIMYVRSNSYTQAADNIKYRKLKQYEVTVIDRDIDSPIPDRVEALQYTYYDRQFVADGLYHTIFQLYF